MNRNVGSELERFSALIARLGTAYDVEELCPFAYGITPRSCKTKVPADKRFAVTIFGITHGNEVAGLGAVNDYLRLLAYGAVRLNVPIAIGLGNPEAAKINRRFIERDLNRSFASTDASSLEGRRAKQLEKILGNTYRFLDFHQTTQLCEMPFFIFPHSGAGFNFARQVDPERAIITHWGDSFSSEGMCTDEFVNIHGGAGISMELGRNGFDAYQISLGVSAAIWAVRAVEMELSDSGFEKPLHQAEKSGPIFTWEAIVDWPAVGNPVLDPGWHNFRKVKMGERLGEMDGTLIHAVASGRMLFPKYPDPDPKPARRPTELYRLLKEISVADLPTE